MDIENKSPKNKNKLYSMMGIASGIAIGVAIGVAVHNVAIGITLCVCFQCSL